MNFVEGKDLDTLLVLKTIIGWILFYTILKVIDYL